MVLAISTVRDAMALNTGTGYQVESATPAPDPAHMVAQQWGLHIQLAPRCHAADLEAQPEDTTTVRTRIPSVRSSTLDPLPQAVHIAAPPRAPPPQRPMAFHRSSGAAVQVRDAPANVRGADQSLHLKVIQSRRRQYETPQSSPQCFCIHEADEDKPAFLISLDFPHTMESFIGMMVTPGYALIDTGAQHGVIGLKEYQGLCERLAAVGLKPKQLPTFLAKAVGVGGTTEFLQTVEIPVGIQGVSGVVNMNVIESELPPLLPIPFLKRLGMLYDAEDGLVTWKNLGYRISEVETLPSGHVAIDLLEFPPGGWICPHQTPGKMVQNPDRATTRAGAGQTTRRRRAAQPRP